MNARSLALVILFILSPILPAQFPKPTQSSSIAITSDGKLLACVNTDGGTLAIFDIMEEQPKKLAEVLYSPP